MEGTTKVVSEKVEEALRCRNFFSGKLAVEWYNNSRMEILRQVRKDTANGGVNPLRCMAQLIRTRDSVEVGTDEYVVEPPKCGFRRLGAPAAAGTIIDQQRSDGGRIEFEDRSLSYIVGCEPLFFDREVIPHATGRRLRPITRTIQSDDSGDQGIDDALLSSPLSSSHVVECATRAALDSVLNQISHALKATGIGVDCHVWDVDRAPYLHAQTLGWVAGVTDHIEMHQVADDSEWQRALQDAIDAKQTAESRDSRAVRATPFGVSLHPQFGGWFAFRYLLTFPALLLSQSIARPALRFASDEQRKFVVWEYNMRYEAAAWRDVSASSGSCSGSVPNCDATVPLRTYSPEAYLYFHTQSLKVRRKYWKMKRAETEQNVARRAILSSDGDVGGERQTETDEESVGMLQEEEQDTAGAAALLGEKYLLAKTSNHLVKKRYHQMLDSS